MRFEVGKCQSNASIQTLRQRGEGIMAQHTTIRRMVEKGANDDDDRRKVDEPPPVYPEVVAGWSPPLRGLRAPSGGKILRLTGEF